MGDKQIQGAKLSRPTRRMPGRSDGLTMVRALNVFAGTTHTGGSPRRKRASTASKPASSSKSTAKSPEDIASARARNLKKANRALRKARAAKKT